METVSDGSSAELVLALEENLAAFDQHLAIRRKAPSTRAKYRMVIEEFIGHASTLPVREIHEIRVADIDNYFAEYQRSFESSLGRPPSAHSLAARYSALSRFFGYLDRTDRLVDASGRSSPNPMRRVEPFRRPKRPIDYLTVEEQQRLIDATVDRHERIVVHMLLFAGLRRAELRHLRLADVVMSPGAEAVRVADTKSDDGVRQIPVIPELLAELSAWLRYREAVRLIEHHGTFLVTSRGQAAGVNYVANVIQRVARRGDLRIDPSGRSSVTPHVLRRTFATNLLNQGMTITLVSNLLGHSSVVITERAYAKLGQAAIRLELQNRRVA